MTIEDKTSLEEIKKKDKENLKKSKEEFKKQALTDDERPADFLTEEARSNIIKTLKKSHIYTEGLSDSELLEKLQTEYTIVKKIKDNLIEASGEKNTLAQRLFSYINTADSLLTDKPFVTRLFNMGVPPEFLKLFRDADSTFADSKIWEVIRFSGIKCYEHDLSALLSKRTPIGSAAKKLIQDRLNQAA